MISVGYVTAPNSCAAMGGTEISCPRHPLRLTDKAHRRVGTGRLYARAGIVTSITSLDYIWSRPRWPATGAGHEPRISPETRRAGA